MEKRKRILSGITSTGRLTLGNYLGAIKNFINLQDKNELFIFIANLHAITTAIEPDVLKKNTLEIASWYFACGIDPNKTNIFVQSDILEHTQLGYILMCHSSIGELERMTQFKEKSQKNNQQNKTISIPSGLLFYPTLMAADILLYDADTVPVGSDQTQHLELTRELAIRINNKYKNQVFKVPELYKNNISHRIMSLQEPTKKMSKSDTNENNVIYLSDNLEQITKKIMKAVTDSENIIKYDIVNKPGVSNLLTIYAALNNLSINECEQLFVNKNYGDLKIAIVNNVWILLSSIQERFNYYKQNQQLLIEMLKEGTDKAKIVASKKLAKVQNILGINWDNR